MPLFEGSHNFIINGGCFMDRSGLNGLQYLAQHIASQATHDAAASRERPLCHPGTRNRVLNQIIHWATSTETDAMIFWLYGPAGVGNSAIAQTVAVKLSALGILGATFFFSRSDPTRNNVSHLFLTIAYQLAISWSSPDLRLAVERIVERDPNVVNQRLELQWEKLILGPVRKILENDAANDARTVMTILVDGLDECLTENEQIDVIKILSIHDLPFRVIISSRPEGHLYDLAQAEKFKCHGLLRTTEVDDEIKTYLRDSFHTLRSQRKYRASMKDVSCPWPSDAILNKLVDKASGQFIYASTVLTYVQSRKETPVVLLSHVLEFQDHRGAFTELDMLYQGILSKSLENADYLDRTLSIIGFMLLLLREERFVLLPTLSVIDQLLHLGPGEMGLALDGLQSLIHIPDLGLLSTWEIQEPMFYHATLEDFFTDKTRSGKYFIDLNVISQKLISCCTVSFATGPIHLEGHIHLHADDEHSTCNLFGWYYSLSKMEIQRSGIQDFSNIESILTRIVNKLVVPQDDDTNQIFSAEGVQRQLALRPSLEELIIISSLIISKMNNVAVQSNLDMVSCIGVDQRQPFADLLDLLICNPYISAPFKAALFGYLSEFLQSKIVPLNYQLPDLVIWEETPFASGIFAEIFCGTYKHHKVCIRRDKRYYRAIDKAVFKKVPHPILTSRHLIHPNLIPFYGVEILPSLQDGNLSSHPLLDWAICAIVPFMEGGNILHYLDNKCPHGNQDVYWLLISDIASALIYINDNGMIIQSWTTEGILVSSNGRAYITGFQSSLYSFYEDLTWETMENASATELEISVRYTTPEILNPGAYNLTTRSNIYIFATICYEILTGVIPFSDDHDINPLQEKIVRGHNPTKPLTSEKCWRCNGGPLKEEHWNLLLECWSLDPRKRPDISEIYDRLHLKELVDNRPKDNWELTAHFSDLQYCAQFVTTGAIGSLFSLLQSFNHV